MGHGHIPLSGSADLADSRGYSTRGLERCRLLSQTRLGETAQHHGEPVLSCFLRAVFLFFSFTNPHFSKASPLISVGCFPAVTGVDRRSRSDLLLPGSGLRRASRLRQLQPVSQQLLQVGLKDQDVLFCQFILEAQTILTFCSCQGRVGHQLGELSDQLPVGLRHLHSAGIHGRNAASERG